jgi:hypothetical protein
VAIFGHIEMGDLRMGWEISQLFIKGQILKLFTFEKAPVAQFKVSRSQQ